MRLASRIGALQRNLEMRVGNAATSVSRVATAAAAALGLAILEREFALYGADDLMISPTSSSMTLCRAPG